METGILERIRLIMKEYKLSERQFALKIGVTPSVINTMFQRKQDNVKLSTIVSILNAFVEINADWLVMGRGEMIVRKEYPTTEEGLKVLALKSYPKKGWDGPYVNHIVNDPWGNEYVYETRPEGGNPILYSKGPDGRAGTTDDVLPDQAAFDEPFRDTTWTNGWAPYRLRGVVVAPDEETKRRVQEEMKEYDRK